MTRETEKPSCSSPSPTAVCPCRVVQTDRFSPQTLRSVAFPHACIHLSGSRARPQQKYLRARQYKPVQGPSTEYLAAWQLHRQLHRPGQASMLISRAPAQILQLGPGKGSQIPDWLAQWASGTWDVTTRSRLSRLDRRSLCGSPDPISGPAASEISQLRYFRGLQSIENGINDQKLLSLAGRPVHLDAGQSVRACMPDPQHGPKEAKTASTVEGLAQAPAG